MKCEIFEQQTIKHKKTIHKQKAKFDQGAKHNCIEDLWGEYQIYINAKKQQYKSGQFTTTRYKPPFKLLQAELQDNKNEYNNQDQPEPQIHNTYT